MELVYPIYLDREMMIGFLASLQGGIVELADLEKHTEHSETKTRSTSVGVKISGLWNSIMGGGGELALGKEKARGEKEIYKSIVQYPDIALFIKLRELLLEGNHLRIVEDRLLDEVSVGDIVEISGKALPNPSFQVRDLFKQIEPLLQAVFVANEVQLEQALLQLENAKPGDVIKVDDEEISVPNAKGRSALRRYIESMKKAKQGEKEMYQMMGKALSELFPANGTDVVAVDCSQFRVVCRLYPELARKGRVQDIYGAQWRCIGKVIDKIPNGGLVDLLEGLPISYFAGEQFSSVIQAFNNEFVGVNFNNAKVEGSALVLATMAIFA